MLSESTVVITCEHGGNEVPAEWQELFPGAEEVLASHRGYDPGALELAQRFARELQTPLIFSTTSRLLVELNRSVGHPRLFSEFTHRLASTEKSVLLAGYYHPYRSEVRRVIENSLTESRRVVHISVHSFTPVFEGVERPIDIGLLYDPQRRGELSFCRTWRNALLESERDLRVRRNAPYRGTSDGLVTELRRSYAADAYIGVELEVNQRYPLAEPMVWPPLQRVLIETFLDALPSAFAQAKVG